MADSTLKNQVTAIHNEAEAFREWLERGEEVEMDDIFRTIQNLCYAFFTVNKRLEALERLNKLREVE